MKLSYAYLSVAFGSLTLIPTGLNACELHTGGNFGFGVGQFHPLAQQHYQASAFKTLSIKHAKKLSVTVDEAAYAKIAYVVPLRYRDVSVSFEGSDHVVINEDSAVLLKRDSGVYNLAFTVKHPGTSYITVKIEGTQDGKPFSLNQKIELNSA